MSTNPLKTPPKGNLFRAAEYAMQAEAMGKPLVAKAWWEADRKGWDDEHYDPARNAKHREQIRKGVSPK